jgi:DNA-binding transcriptional regulator YdaS (Cro superfamily)
MELLDYISDPDRKAALAEATGAAPAYLYLVATEWKKRADRLPTRASPELAQAIEKATGGLVLCGVGRGMRSDLQWVRDSNGDVTGYFVPAAVA